jgi:hypothetical protein
MGALTQAPRHSTWLRKDYFDDGEQAVLGGLAALDAQVVFGGLHHFSRAANHAGRRAAELQVVFAHSLSVVHRVESRHLEDVDFRDFEHFSHLLHG